MCPSCAAIAEDSELEMVLVGGLSIGGHVSRRHWVLRPIRDRERERQRAQGLQRLAAAARLISDCHAWISSHSRPANPRLVDRTGLFIRNGCEFHCEWREDENGTWRTGCGESFEFVVGGPRDNGARYCQYCGATLVQVAAGDRHPDLFEGG